MKGKTSMNSIEVLKRHKESKLSHSMKNIKKKSFQMILIFKNSMNETIANNQAKKKIKKSTKA